jgi:hypothetical protein
VGALRPHFCLEIHMNKLEKTIYEILSKTPIDIIEDTDYEHTISASERWCLTTPRKDGLAKGTTKIGYFNIWVAVKVISESYNKSFDDESNIDKLSNICDNLSKYGVIKEHPEYKRNNFKLITNEELDAKRKTRVVTYQSSHD